MKALLPGAILSCALLAVAQDKSPAASGRAVYAEQACWQCHIQVRDRKFPKMTDLKRTGPLLDRNVPPRSAAWHMAHFFAPRSVVADSVMPAYPREFTPHAGAAAVDAFLTRHDKNGDGVVTPIEHEGRDFPDGLDTSGNGIVSRADAAPVPSAELIALTGYLASIEHARLPKPMPPQEAKPTDAAASIVRGQEVFLRHCAGCHGKRADGNGAVAAFFPEHPPRNFLVGEFKFRSTMAPEPPADRDLFRTIRQGAGPSMPAWPKLTDREVWDLVEFVKSHHPYYMPRQLTVNGGDTDTFDVPGLLKQAGVWFLGDAPVTDGMKAGELTLTLGAPIYDWMGDFAPKPIALPKSGVAYSVASAAVGAKVYAEFGCANCHGSKGRGDGVNVAKVRGQIIKPTDYTRGAAWLKGGATARDLVRSFLTGLHGTPMPAYASNFKAAKSAAPDKAPWHLAHFIMRQAKIPFER